MLIEASLGHFLKSFSLLSSTSALASDFKPIEAKPVFFSIASTLLQQVEKCGSGHAEIGNLRAIAGVPPAAASLPHFPAKPMQPGNVWVGPCWHHESHIGMPFGLCGTQVYSESSVQKAAAGERP